MSSFTSRPGPNSRGVPISHSNVVSHEEGDSKARVASVPMALAADRSICSQNPHELSKPYGYHPMLHSVTSATCSYSLSFPLLIQEMFVRPTISADGSLCSKCVRHRVDGGDRSHRYPSLRLWVSLLVLFSLFSPAETACTHPRENPATYQPLPGTLSVPPEHGVRKRSFLRACRRALRFGHTMYKGRPLRQNQVPSEITAPVIQTGTANTCNKGLRTFMWNCGGLGGGLYEELMVYLDSSDLDIAVILETRWSKDLEYSTDRWHMVHSAPGAKDHGGILIAVNQRLCPSHKLQLQMHIPGRVLQIRLPAPRNARNIHVLAVYQKAWNSQDPDIYDKRHKIWNSLDSVMQSVPQRDHLLLTGDFNTQLYPHAPTVGPVTGPLAADRALDETTFLDMLRTQSMIALNTWTGTPKRSCTFVFGDYRSQIDYILVRRSDARLQARRCTTIPGFQVGASRMGGAHHLPLVAQIPLRYWQCYQTDPALPAANRQIDREQLIACTRQCPPSVKAHSTSSDCAGPDPKLSKLRTYQQKVQEGLQSLAPTASITQLHKVVHEAAVAVFPAEQTAAKPRLWHHPDVQMGVSKLWQAYKAMRATKPTTFMNIFRLWRRVTAYQKLHRQHRQCCNHLKRQRYLDAIQEADDAAAQGNIRALYQVVHRLAPKSFRRRWRISDDQGRLVPMPQQATIVQKSLTTRFAASDQDRCMQNDWTLNISAIPPASTLTSLIKQCPLRKATPAGQPPSAAWRPVAEEVGVWLHNHMKQCWSTKNARVDVEWRDTSLALIPKSAKSGKDPEHYRPIGLQCPLGKITFAAAIQPLKAHIYEHILTLPQYAYCPNRSHRDALARVFMHCSQIRGKLAAFAPNLHNRFAGHKPTALYGALQLSVDLTQAFDRMPRSRLLSSMRRIALPQNLVHLVMSWHSQATYWFRHGGKEYSVPAEQGIRQGCSVAPLLWLIFVHSITMDLADRIGLEVVLAALTLFADDFHWAQEFSSMSQLEATIDNIKLLFRLLKNHGMTLSPTKSKAILVLRGTLAQTARQRYTANTPEGKALRLQHLSGDVHIPLVSQFVYLGAVASYGPFEMLTLKHRISCGMANFWRMVKILRGRHTLSPRIRCELWRACVWSSISYSLNSCGLTEASSALLTSTILRQLRSLYKDPVHISHVSHSDFLSKHGLMSPVKMLQVAMDNEQPKPHDPLACHPHCPWWEHVYQSLKEPPMKSLQAVEGSSCQATACSICGLYFANSSAVLIHQAKKHPEHQRATQIGHTFHKLRDSLHGLPQCKYCHKKFPKWPGLKAHINGGHCKVLTSQAACPTTTTDVPTPAHHTAPGNDQLSPNPPQITNPAPGQSISKTPVGTTPLQAELPETTQLSDTPANFDATMWAVPDQLSKLISAKGQNAIYVYETRRTLAQHCARCGQWIVHSRMMKVHWQKAHPELFLQHQAQATAASLKFPSPGSPCVFCGSTMLNPRAHRAKCTVLWQFLLYHFFLRSHDGRGSPGLRNDGHVRNSECPGASADAVLVESGTTPERGASEGLGRMAHANGKSSATCPSPKCLTVPTLSAAAHETAASPSLRDRAADGQTTGMAPGRGLDLPAVEPKWEEPRGRCGASPGYNDDNPPGHRAGTPRREGGGLGLSLPLDPAATGEHHQQQSPCVSARCGTSSPGLHEDLASPGDMPRPCGPATHRPPGAAGELAAIEVGQRSGQATLIGILCRVLSNPSNLCYINSWALAYSWACTQLAPTITSSWGLHMQAWRDAIWSKEATDLTRLPSWRRLLRTWRNVHHQHDVFEFACHVQALNQPPLSLGSWQARMGDDMGYQIWDHGTTQYAIPLQIPASTPDPPLTLQTLINNWHFQHVPFALSTPPDLLCFLLTRYTLQPSARLTYEKNTCAIQLPRLVRVPCFLEESLTCRWLRYRLASVIVHTGDSPEQGHYTSVLVSGSGTWGTNDHRRAQLTSLEDVSTVNGCYMLWMVRHDRSPVRGAGTTM